MPRPALARVATLALVVAVSAGSTWSASGVEKPAPRGRNSAQGGNVVFLTRDGSAVGPLEKHRVPDKYTVFDFFADWCAPCRLVDAHLREILKQRTDVAVRKLNIVDFDSPLARELGPDFEALPYLVVIDPEGRRTEIIGADFEALDAALQPKERTTDPHPEAR